MARMEGPVGMACPACGQHPALALDPEQVFCGNEACKIISWNPTKTMDELLDDWNVVDLEGLD